MKQFFIITMLFFSFSSVVNSATPSRAVASIEKYGLKASIGFCEQSGRSIKCPFTIRNISQEDMSFNMGLNHLMVNHLGFEYKRTRIIRDDGQKINGIGGSTLLIPGLSRNFLIEFVGVKEKSNRLPRVFVEWSIKACYSRFTSCPDVRFNNVQVK